MMDPLRDGAVMLTVTKAEGLVGQSPLVRGRIDQPKLGPVGGELQISGWAVAESGPLSGILAFADGSLLARVRADLQRPDLAEAFPDVPHAPRSGFRLLVPRALAAQIDELVIAADVGERSPIPFWEISLETDGRDLSQPGEPSSPRLRIWDRLVPRQASQPAAVNGARRKLRSSYPAETFRVVALISAYNEADIIGQVLDHLEANGTWAYVIDNGSTDGTLDIVRARLARNVIGLESMLAEADGKVRWGAILDRKMTLSRELGADWYIHHDADEIREGPWPGVSMRDALQTVDRLGYNAVDFRVLNFPPVDDSFRPGEEDPYLHFTRWTDPGDFDHLQRKCWKGGVSEASLELGGHDIQFEGRKLFPLRFVLCHYPIRGQTHGMRKVLGERANRFADAELADGWHVQYNHVRGPDHLFLVNPAELRPFGLDSVRLETLLEDAAGAERPEDAVAAARTGTATPVRGALERVTADAISGWVVAEPPTHGPIELDIWVGSDLIATVVADRPRSDLVERGLGDGSIGGFAVKTPRSLADGRPHWIWATVAGSGEALARSPQVLHTEGRVLIGTDTGTAAGETE
jgi:hypothetical protein